MQGRAHSMLKGSGDKLPTLPGTYSTLISPPASLSGTSAGLWTELLAHQSVEVASNSLASRQVVKHASWTLHMDWWPMQL